MFISEGVRIDGVTPGFAMAAAVVAGIYPNTAEAQKNGRGENRNHPIRENVEKYKPLYGKYKKLGKLIEFEC